MTESHHSPPTFLRRHAIWHILAVCLWITLIALIPEWSKHDNRVMVVFGWLAPLLWPASYGFSCVAVYVLTIVKDHWIWGLWLPVHIASAVYFLDPML